MTEETLATLMVKVADGQASSVERDELMAFIHDKPDLLKELQMHESLKGLTDDWVHRLEQDLRDDQARRSFLPRLWSGLGVSLVVGGLAVLTGGSVVELLLDPEAPWWMKLGMGSFFGGGVMLLAGLILHRLRTAKSDPYTEVIR